MLKNANFQSSPEVTIKRMKASMTIFSVMSGVARVIVMVNVIILATGCGNRTDDSKSNETQAENVPTQSLITGKVTENIDNPNHTYYYYLPSNYKKSQVWPVIYCFDSHGRGILPVSSYKDLAEKHGCILIGSNKSRNGMVWEETLSHITIITEQVDSQLTINKKRIYAMGFSGGARVAVSMALYTDAVAGVIGCAAGFPQLKQKLSKRFDYLGIVGSYDFNYQEMLQLNQQLKDSEFNSHLLIFDGKHEWPDIDVMKDGFSWMDLNSIRSGRATYHDSLIEISFHLETQLTDKMLNEQAHPLKLYRQYEKIVNFYKGIRNTAKVEQQLELLSNNPMMKKILAKHDDILIQESEIKGEYAKALAEQPAEWWETEAERMAKLIDSEDDYVNHCSYLRVMSHLSLVSYLQCDAAIKQNELTSALRFIDIFSYIDPNNADHAYFRGLLFAKKGQMNEALNSLNKAMELGFDDMDKLNSETLFSSILDQVISKPL